MRFAWIQMKWKLLHEKHDSYIEKRRWSSLKLFIFAHCLTATRLGLTETVSRNRRPDWTDAVTGLRANYAHNSGWGVNGWADIGVGSDSSSYQLAAFINFKLDNNIRLFSGYRHLNFEYEDGSDESRFEIDVDYSGPVLGVSYAFLV